MEGFLFKIHLLVCACRGACRVYVPSRSKHQMFFSVTLGLFLWGTISPHELGPCAFSVRQAPASPVNPPVSGSLELGNAGVCAMTSLWVLGSQNWFSKLCSKCSEPSLQPHRMEFYSVINKNKIGSSAGKWVELETIMLNEMWVSQKQVPHSYSHMSCVIYHTYDMKVEGVLLKEEGEQWETGKRKGWWGANISKVYNTYTWKWHN